MAGSGTDEKPVCFFVFVFLIIKASVPDVFIALTTTGEVLPQKTSQNIHLLHEILIFVLQDVPEELVTMAERYDKHRELKAREGMGGRRDGGRRDGGWKGRKS